MNSLASWGLSVGERGECSPRCVTHRCAVSKKLVTCTCRVYGCDVSAWWSRRGGGGAISRRERPGARGRRAAPAGCRGEPVPLRRGGPTARALRPALSAATPGRSATGPQGPYAGAGRAVRRGREGRTPGDELPGSGGPGRSSPAAGKARPERDSRASRRRGAGRVANAVRPGGRPDRGAAGARPGLSALETAAGVAYDGRRRRGVALRRTVDILLSSSEPAPGGRSRTRPASETFGQAVHARARTAGRSVCCRAEVSCVKAQHSRRGSPDRLRNR